jgi:hypothetical protein
LLFLIAAVLLLTQENLQGRISTGKTEKYRTSENSCRIGSLPSACQVLQQAPLSLAVLMDGEPSLHGGRCLFPNAPHVTTKALPLLPPVEQRASEKAAFSYLPISI